MIIGIIHAKREFNFIGRTIDNLNDEFFNIPIHVFCEPDSELFENHTKVQVYKNKKQLGPFHNWINALKIINKSRCNDWILMCEDDILWLPETGKYFLEYLNQVQDDRNIGFVSGYCSFANANKRGFGLAKVSAYGWCGALALAIPIKNIDLIINHPLIQEESIHLDNLIGKILLDLDKKLIIHTPSLVEHLGVNCSTLVPNSSLYSSARRIYDYPTHCLRIALSKFG